MKPSPIQLLKQFAEFIPYVEALARYGNELWDRPLQEGKWTVQQIIAHILLWDQYFYEQAIRHLGTGASLPLRHLDFDEFNKQAVIFSHQHGKEDIVRLAMEYRQRIVDRIGQLTEEDYHVPYVDRDGNGFTVYEYLIGFVPHDNHHMQQIEQCLEAARRCTV
ncbi:DinB family protein [Paenibacillus sp. OAS669]|uniref:DinB family protein n=1 Tax=Paenibacillus sp. OAS669 TaxID=2663821 RepID=UPI00178B37C5|nr:DinB family protein [Paenibacillus sp. OAS669]MBE1443396.1 putative damage-inducible protein DinB [Paenibacillus sp. OAS669]